jgi:hypothetical protein
VSLLVEEPEKPDAPPRPWRVALFYERDGSLNLSWVILGLFTLLSVVAIIAGLLTRQPLVYVAVLSFLAVTLNLFALGAFSQNKAKIVAQARNIGEAGRAVAGVGGRDLFGPSTLDFDGGLDFDYQRDRGAPRPLPDEVG